jgi:hypothetical protein
MKRQVVVGTAGALIFLLGGFLLYGYLQPPTGAAPEFLGWPPTAAAIRSKIGTAAAPAPGMSDADRRSQFCAMFKGRFRDHDPAIAVGLRFLTPTRIKLMCPARMEPCYIDQIALSAWHEAQDYFGKPVDIDIFDTFIGTTQIKIGELRNSLDKPDMAHISYDFRALNQVMRPHTGRRSRPALLFERMPMPRPGAGQFQLGRRPLQ